MESNGIKLQCNGTLEENADYLYDPAILMEINWTPAQHMKNGVTAQTPGEGYVVRPLKRDDYKRGYVKLLGQMTKVIDLSKQQFQERFDKMKNCTGHYYITVIEDICKGQIVAAATLSVELKYIRGGVKRGRLEDVVVDDNYRGKQFGKLIVTTITLLAQIVGCYKIGLDCRDTLRKFYQYIGYSSEEGNDRTMIIRF